MTKICRVRPWCAGPFEMWQVELNGACVVVLRSRGEALEAARRIVGECEQAGIACESYLSGAKPPFRSAA